MKNYRLFSLTCIFIGLMFVFAAFPGVARAQTSQGKIVATIEFDPEVDGFGFQNPGNEHRWQDDLDAGDLITMFGVAPVCVTGNTASTCRIKRPAENWRIKTLKGMGEGHCEGMAVTSLLFFEQREYKNRWKLPTHFQKDAETVFDLKYSLQSVQNYIAYFFATQEFSEISRISERSKVAGPLANVKTLISSMNTEGGELYTLGICKFEDGDYKDCHAVTPIAVEDNGEYYTIHIYDNNNPGKTRFMTVEKTGLNQWEYNAAPNPNTAEDLYIGDKQTKSFDLIPISARLYGKKYRAPFGTSRENAAIQNNQSIFRNATFSNFQTSETVEFSVNGDADMLITSGDGKHVGYDWTKKQTLNEIAGAEMINIRTGGSDDDLPPIIRLPFQPSGKPYTVTLSGKSLKREDYSDLMFTGPGFSVGFDGIQLDPNETLTFQISPDGTHLSFTASTDTETPEIYFTVNAENGASYQLEVDGVELDAGKTLFADVDIKAGKLHFRDNDGRHEKYDIDFLRILPDGTEQTFETDDIDIGESDRLEMDFSNWDGKTPMCFREDDEGNGFSDEECEPQPNEDDGTDTDEYGKTSDSRFLQAIGLFR